MLTMTKFWSYQVEYLSEWEEERQQIVAKKMAIVSKAVVGITV